MEVLNKAKMLLKGSEKEPSNYAITEYCIFMLDPDGYVVSWNTGAKRLQGYDERAILGEHFSIFYTDADAEQGIPQQNLVTAAETGQCEDEGWRVRNEGSQFWANTAITAIYDTGGTLRGFANITHDLTERKEYERQLEQYATTVAAATDAIVTINAQSTIQSVNPAVSEVFGYEPNELLGEPLTILIPPRLMQPYREELHRYLETGERHLNRDYIEITGQHADGHEIPLAVSFSEYTYDGEQFFVSIIRDNTKQKAYQRELKRYETLLKESTDVNAVIDIDGTFQYLTPSVEPVLGYATDELIGETVFEYVHPDDREDAMANYRLMADQSDDQLTAEFRFRHKDGSWRVLEARSQNLIDDPLIEGVAVYTRDITAHLEYEQQLKRQREQLAALNQLNQLVQDITYAIVESSSRSELEQIVCDHLVASDSYQFAWIGNRKGDAEKLSIRATAGVEGVLDESYLPIHKPKADQNLAITALQTREMQTLQHVDGNAVYETVEGQDDEYRYRSVAAIPIEYDSTQYGVLSIYSERPDAFDGEERAVISQLGEVIGYVLTAIDRKEALISDRVVELEFQSENLAKRYTDILGTDGRVTIDRTIPLEDGMLQYYTITRADCDNITDALDQLPFVADVRCLKELDTEARYEVRVTNETAAGIFARYGGRLKIVQIDPKIATLTAEFAEGIDVRQVLEALQRAYPDLELIAKKTSVRQELSILDLDAFLFEDLTERQQTVLETAFHAGFFEWPRLSTGEEMAAELGVSPSTFHEHLRRGQLKLLSRLFGDTSERN